MHGFDALTQTAERARAGRQPMVGPPEIQAIRDAASDADRLRRLYGGAQATKDCATAAHDAGVVLATARTRRFADELATATGWLMMSIGAACHDAGYDRDAESWWTHAADAAAGAHNHSLMARVQGWQGRMAIWLGRPHEATGLLSRGIHMDRLVPRERALLWALQAQAHALAGELDSTRLAVGLADDEFTDAQIGNDEDRPWIAPYDLGLHLGDTAAAMLWAAEREGAGLPEATQRCRLSLDAYDASSAIGTKALGSLEMATTCMIADDPHDAAPIAHEALTVSEGLASSRVKQRVLELGGHAGQRGVTDVAERVQGLVR